MRLTILTLFIAALALSFCYAADEGSWFDMQNCEYCKHLLEDPQLMNNMTWEHKSISNGMISIAKVQPAYLESYKKARAKMDAVSQRIMGGENVHICNMCKGMLSIQKAGANMNLVESDNVFIAVTTAENPEVVGMIHSWGERTNREMKALGTKGQEAQE
jgi:hypothetical protein